MPDAYQSRTDLEDEICALLVALDVSDYSQGPRDRLRQTEVPFDLMANGHQYGHLLFDVYVDDDAYIEHAGLHPFDGVLRATELHDWVVRIEVAYKIRTGHEQADRRAATLCMEAIAREAADTAGFKDRRIESAERTRANVPSKGASQTVGVAGWLRLDIVIGLLVLQPKEVAS